MKKRILIFSITAVLLASFLVVCIVNSPRPEAMPPVIASAQMVLDFSQTDVMEDLQSATINGAPFDIRNYQPRSNAPMQMIHMVEWAFGFHLENRANFGLFIYIFNPGLFQFPAFSTHNRIQMTIRNDFHGLPIFEKFPVRLLSSSTGDIANMFHKFQIVFTPAQQRTLIDNLNAHQRVYDISGIEFSLLPDFRIVDFHIGRTFTYTGFAQGFGPNPNAESTLSARVDGRRTLSLDVHPTWWRSLTSNRGRGFRHQVNSVYFSVPNSVLAEFGQLQKIMAEWWEYKTQPIVVTTRASTYSRLSNIIGQRVRGRNDLQYGLYLNYWYAGAAGFFADWIFNDIHRDRWHINARPEVAEHLYYLFKVDRITRDTNRWPSGTISAEVLEDWILDYDKSFKKGRVYVGGREVSADLFLDRLDDHREGAGSRRGHNKINFDYGDTFDFLSYMEGNPSFWQQVNDLGIANAIGGLFGLTNREIYQDTGRENVHPIYQLPRQFPSGRDADISNDLMVGLNDIPALRGFHEQATNGDETVFLFRFALTDYFSDWLGIYDRDHGLFGAPWPIVGNMITEQAYLAQQTVFFNFDIIQLTFRDDFGYYVIPVVSNPINIIPDLRPPVWPSRPQLPTMPNIFDLLQTLFIILAIIIVVVVAWVVLYSVFGKKRRRY